MSNFNYCPLVWHFCGKENNSKLEKIQERSLRILYNDYVSSYSDLLSNAGTSTLLISRLKLMALETFKCVKGDNPKCLNNIFHVKDVPYDLRHQVNLEQPRRRSAMHGLRSFSYIGSKLWNSLPVHFKSLDEIDVVNFKAMINEWDGPSDLDTFSHYV